MVPPLAMALASTVLARKLFTPSSVRTARRRGFWVRPSSPKVRFRSPRPTPLRVIPASMVGGAVTGALCMLFQVASYAPHGGIFVLFAISPIWGFLVASPRECS
jgi:PTS system fructose-specific IIC component